MPEIVERAAGLYTIDHPLKIGPVPIGTRTTLVRLGSGSLFMHSPGPIDAEGAAAIQALAPVGALVAPNCFHHFFVDANAAAFPEAEIFLAPGLAERGKVKAGGTPLAADAPAAWADDVDQLVIEGGPRVGEVAFRHRTSRTLLLTDLVFNIRDSASGIAGWILKVNGMAGRFGPSHAAKHLMFRDRAGLRRSLNRLLEWDFDRVIVTHGEVVESGGRGLLEEAFAYLPR